MLFRCDVSKSANNKNGKKTSIKLETNKMAKLNRPKFKYQYLRTVDPDEVIFFIKSIFDN